MSSPAFTRRDSHHAIHQAAFDEAEQLTRVLRHTMQTGEHDRALRLAAVLIEHWQTRTLRHADAEEEGWYREIVAARPELQPDVAALTRDHDLLRTLLAEIQGILAQHGIASGITERFEAMLLLNAIHSREEERRLLGHDTRGDDAPAAAPQSPSASTIPTGAIPLSAARPALHARLVAHLRTRGLSPGDLLADMRDGESGPIMCVACGPGFSQTSEWALPDTSDETAAETLLEDVSAWCEALVKADYQQRMRVSSQIQPNTRPS